MTNNNNKELKFRYINQHYSSWSDEQKTRFEFFARSHLNRTKVKNIIGAVVQANSGNQRDITDEIAIIVSGVAKLYVGEIVEMACQVSKGMDSPAGVALSPDMIIEAVRRIRNAQTANSRLKSLSQKKSIVTPSFEDEFDTDLDLPQSPSNEHVTENDDNNNGNNNDDEEDDLEKLLQQTEQETLMIPTPLETTS